jgi:hypothetical protein
MTQVAVMWTQEMHAEFGKAFGMSEVRSLLGEYCQTEIFLTLFFFLKRKLVQAAFYERGSELSVFLTELIQCVWEGCLLPHFLY